ncbi:MAG: exodeoxyribonuclease III [Pseudomonadota bacterium]
MKIATWNVNSLRVRLPHLLDWLAQQQADVLALQETKVQDCDFPQAEITAAGYHVVFSGQKTFNGVAILSRAIAEDVTVGLPGFVDDQCRVISATVRGIRVINFYVPNGQSVGSDKYQYKLRWLSAATDFIRQAFETYPKVVVVGDFNIAPEDRDVHDPALWTGKVLVSDDERQALKTILALGLKDLFRHFDQEENSFSWWDYRGGQFWKNAGLRIDLMLANDALIQTCQSCVIDTRPRKRKRPSDHAPVLASFCC